MAGVRIGVGGGIVRTPKAVKLEAGGARILERDNLSADDSSGLNIRQSWNRGAGRYTLTREYTSDKADVEGEGELWKGTLKSNRVELRLK
jgi:hypothetical protein